MAFNNRFVVNNQQRMQIRTFQQQASGGVSDGKTYPIKGLQSTGRRPEIYGNKAPFSQAALESLLLATGTILTDNGLTKGEIAIFHPWTAGFKTAGFSLLESTFPIIKTTATIQRINQSPSLISQPTQLHLTLPEWVDFITPPSMGKLARDLDCSPNLQGFVCGTKEELQNNLEQIQSGRYAVYFNIVPLFLLDI